MVDGGELPFAPSCIESDQARPWEISEHNSPPTIHASLQPLPYHQLQDAPPAQKHPE